MPGLPWFRLYAEFAHDPKVQMMPEEMQRRLVMLMALRCSNGDETLHETEVGFQLRISDAELAKTKALFIARGFMDQHWQLLNWAKRQFLSESSTERVKAHRERKKQAMKQNETLLKPFRNAPDTDTDTDTEQREISTARASQDATAPQPQGENRDEEPTPRPAEEQGLCVAKQEPDAGQSQEQFTGESERDAKIITPQWAKHCNLLASTAEENTSHPETDALPSGVTEDESGGAGLPAMVQQGHHGALVKPEQAANNMQQVILRDWPEGEDRNEAVKKLLRLHPRPALGWNCITAVIDQIERLAAERGKGEREAYAYLLGRVRAYAAATQTWPADERGFIVGALNFMTDEVYRQDEAIWRKSNGGDNGDARREGILQQLAEARSTDPGGGRVISLPGSEEFRAKRDALRAAALGPRHGSARRGAF